MYIPNKAAVSFSCEVNNTVNEFLIMLQSNLSMFHEIYFDGWNISVHTIFIRNDN